MLPDEGKTKEQFISELVRLPQRIAEWNISHLFKRLAVIPVPAFIAVIITLAILDIRAVFEPPLGLFVLNTLFLSVVGFVVAYISARSYLLSGLPSLLLLGCGVLALGVTSLVAGLVIDLPDGPNVAVTIFNTGALFASALHLVSAAMTLAGAAPEWVSKHRKLGLMLGYLGVLVFMALLSIVSLQGTIPPFFIQGVGPTLLRQGVLGAAVALFAISSIFFMRYYSKSKSDLLYWYSLGLALITVGLFGVFLQKAVGSPIGWTGRSAQYIGGIYFLVAVLTTIRRARTKTVPLEKVMASFVREAKEHYRALVETASDAIISCDHENTVLLWNSAAEKVFGYSRGEAIGSLLADLIAPDQDAYGLRTELENLGRPEKSHLIRQATEMTAKRKDGKVFPIELSGSTRKTADGWTSTIMVRDITERKQAEKILLESEDKYRKLFELSSDALFLIEVETGRILDLNETALKMYGYSREEALQMKNTDFSAEPSQTRQATIEHKQQIPVRYHRKKDGTIFPTDISVTYFTWYGKEVCVAAIRDITERKQAEEALRETRDYLEKLLNYAHAPIIVWDPAFRVAQFNHAFEHLTGYTAEEVIGRELQMLFPEASRDESLTKIRQTSGGEYWESVEIPILCKGGETRLALWNSANIYEKGGKTLQATIAQGQDITERKRAEEREKELQEELNLSSRLASIGELAAGVAHELNNPLTGIIGFSERLLRKSTDEEISRDLERIHSEAQRVAKVVENLRTFARRREPKKEYLDINEILGRTLELRAYELRTGNIELVVELTPGLPKIFADFGQIQQVFLNIILNAEQVMTEANGGGRLTIKTQKGKGYIRVSFDDDGPGIPSEHFDKLFDPFFTTRGEQGGTGLGLSACHGIMAEHGGKIYAKSRLGKGATFFVELPVAPEEIDESEVAEEEPVRRG